MAVSESVLLKSTEFLGKCYDILELDPFDLASAKATQAIRVDTSRLVEKSGYRIPYSVDLDTITYTEFDKQAAMLLTLDDFQRTFSRGTDFSLGVPGVFQFSLSESYQVFKREITTRKTMVSFVKALHKEYQLNLVLDPAVERPPLDPVFCRHVAELPARSTAAYRRFVERFGTHYATSAALGGQAYQRASMSHESFFQLTQSGTNLNMGAMATFEFAGAPVTIGGGWNNQTAKQHMQQFQAFASVEKIRYSGGTKRGGLDEWAESVCNAPVPVELALTPIWDLLTPEYFPGEPNLRVRKRLLKAAVKSYIQEEGEDGQAGVIRYGDPVFLGLAASRPTVYYLAGPWLPTLPLPKRDPAWAFEFRNPKDLDSRDLVRAGEEVAIYHHGLRKYLSRSGNGVNPAATDPRRPEAQWLIFSGIDSLRDPLLNGHPIHQGELVAFQVPSDGFNLMHVSHFDGGGRPVTVVFASRKHKVDPACQWLVSPPPGQ